MLQKSQEFEGVRRPPRKYPFYHHLIASRPEGPSHSVKDQLEYMAAVPSVISPELEELRKVLGLPVGSKSLANEFPHGPRRHAREDYVSCRLWYRA